MSLRTVTIGKENDVDPHDQRTWAQRQLTRLALALTGWSRRTDGIDRAPEMAAHVPTVLAAWTSSAPERQRRSGTSLADAVVTTAVQLDPGDGSYFAFEVACNDQAGTFLRSGAVRWLYHFTAIGLSYEFDRAEARQWLFAHLGYVRLTMVPGPNGEQQVVACVPFDIFLQEIECVSAASWGHS